MFGPKKRFVFEDFAGTYQLRLKTAEDLKALAILDEVYWMALSAPLDQLKCDPLLLKRLDTSQEGRIHSEEVRQAAAWLLSVLRDTKGVTNTESVLKLGALNTDHPEGQLLFDTARRVLHNLGKFDASTVSLADVRDSQAIFAQGGQNGDGVLPPEAIEEPDVKQLAEDIVTAYGGTSDRSGSNGVDTESLNIFLADIESILAWRARGESFEYAVKERYPLYQTLRPYIDNFFDLSQSARLAEVLGYPVSPCEALSPEAIKAAPLAKPNSGCVLPLKGPVNPAYESLLADFADANAIAGEQLTLDDWRTLKSDFEPYEHWLSAHTREQLDHLSTERLTSILESDIPDRLRELISWDLAAGAELARLQDLEYLLLLQRWFLPLCNNFVSFPDLYHSQRRAMFEMGRLVMDAQQFNLNLKVNDINAHSATALHSGIFLIYSEITGKPEVPPFHIVTPVTRGRVTALTEGKRGVLFDTDNRQWDARIIKVIENPVSLLAVIAAPFKRIGQLISSNIEKISSGAEQQLQTQVTQATSNIDGAVRSGITAPPATSAPQAAAAPAAGGTGFGGILMGGSVAVAALGSSFAFILSKLSEIDSFKFVLIGLIVGLTIVLVPTTLTGYLKLRRRNLSAILEGAGWAINAPMRLTRPLRNMLVDKPVKPGLFHNPLINKDKGSHDN